MEEGEKYQSLLIYEEEGGLNTLPTSCQTLKFLHFHFASLALLKLLKTYLKD